MSSTPVHVHFLWHLHQPYYGVPGGSTNSLPWVRLHATKSYYDMARMLEQFPEIRATVNFSGSLLRQMREYVEEGRRDTWWDLTLKRPGALDERERAHILQHFFSLNWATCVRPYPRYRELLEKRGRDASDVDPSRFSERDYLDLQVWFNLAWFGFSAREERAIVRELIDKGSGFSQAEKEALLEQQIDVMKLVMPLYRELRQRGQLELSVTPMYHPILPLVVDTDSAARATPARPRPARFQAPEDAALHVEKGRAIAREFLGIDVDGMWPAEGSVSPEAVGVFAENSVRWIASDEDVLRRSRGDDWHRDADLHIPWRLRGFAEPWIFFRDHGISDQIGFVYGKNEPKTAVGDFMRRIRRVGDHFDGDAPPIVNVILDGENPWEHYPNDGQAFLERLYAELTDVGDVETTTPTAYLDAHAGDGELGHLHSGSWILGNYQIWIGHPETNRAWELVARAREDLERHVASEDVDSDAVGRAREALLIAEGSDWFWWYGDDFSSENDADFDRLFREQLQRVYTEVGLEPPRDLTDPIATAAARELAFTPPTRLVQPTIDGRTDYYYEWKGAGRYRNTGAHGSMFENTRYIDEIHVGFDIATLFVRVEMGPDLEDGWEGGVFRIVVDTDHGRYIAEISADGGGTGFLTAEDPNRVTPLESVAIDESIELGIPFDELGLESGDAFEIWFAIHDDGVQRERHPGESSLRLEAPDTAFELRNWMV